MGIFRLYLDRRVKCWERNTYKIEADNLEEAKQKLIDIYTQGREYYDEFVESEILNGTFSEVEPEDSYEVTVELLDEDCNLFYNNVNRE